MRRIKTIILTLLIIFIVAGTVSAQFTIEDQKRLMYLTTPNENHELLAKLSGRWKQNYQYTRGERVEYGKGFSENEMIFGSKFLQMFNNIDYFGTVTSTMQILGFDNYEQKFTIYSIDEVGTDSKFAYGVYDPEKEQLVFEQVEDVLTPGKIPFKILITFDRDNKFTYEMFLKEDGKYKRVLLIHNIKLD
jgi:hypothetical protein